MLLGMLSSSCVVAVAIFALFVVVLLVATRSGAAVEHRTVRSVRGVSALEMLRECNREDTAELNASASLLFAAINTVEQTASAPAKRPLVAPLMISTV